MLAQVDFVNIVALCCLCDLLKREKRISAKKTKKNGGACVNFLERL